MGARTRMVSVLVRLTFATYAREAEVARAIDRALDNGTLQDAALDALATADIDATSEEASCVSVEASR